MVLLTGEVDVSGTIYTDSTLFNITVVAPPPPPPDPVNTAPPVLSDPPDDQEMDALETKTYRIDDPTDADGDGIFADAYLNTASALPGFISFDPDTLKFTFEPDEDDDGVYALSVMFTDDNEFPL